METGKGPSDPVRQAIGANIKRIRTLRGRTVRQMSEDLKARGLSLSPSGVSEVESATRKIGADELLIFAITLNTSIIDLFVPGDGHEPIEIAKGVEPLDPWSLEAWLMGHMPWPRSADEQAFYATASEDRKAHQRSNSQSEMVEIAILRNLVQEALEPAADSPDPSELAGMLRRRLKNVNTYVNLIADRLEVTGHIGGDPRPNEDSRFPAELRGMLDDPGKVDDGG